MCRLSQPRKILSQINWALFVEEGYRGNRDDYYDPRNSYLNEVIDRKTGIPISLSVLYQAAGRATRIDSSRERTYPLTSCFDSAIRPNLSSLTSFNSGDILDRRGCERRLSELTGQHRRAVGKPARSLSGASGRGPDAAQSEGHHSGHGGFFDCTSRSTATGRGRPRRPRRTSVIWE